MVWAAQNIHMIDPKACRTWGENFTADKVAPMYEEYFRTILDGWYDTRTDRYQLDWLTRRYPVATPPKTIDAFFQCYNQVYAADKAFESYRKCYPTGKVVMLNDGGDPAMETIATKYGADYEYKPNIGICHWKKPTEWLERFFDAVKRLESDYFVMQEEDVQHRRPVDQTKLMWDICGTNPDARLPAELAEYTGKTHYSGSGGCFFRTEFFKRLAETDWRTHVRTIPAQWLHADIVLSVLTYVYGGTIGYCSECVEIGRPEYETYKSPAVVHQYKVHYETPLCRLARTYGSDKCPTINHTYTPEYHRLLSGLKVTSMLEIGIGNVPLMKPIVGETYRPGASLRMWRDYFPEATIYGCDIDTTVLFEEDRIKTFWVDQSSETCLKERVPDIEYDVILDDGSHDPDHMVTTFNALWDRLVPGGLYIIEDIHVSYVDRLKQLGPVVYIHNGKDSSDMFMAFRKPAQKILWITAFRDIKRETWPLAIRTIEEYFTYFGHLAEGMKGRDFICFIDEPYTERVRKFGVKTLPYDIQDTYIPKHYARHKELIDTQAFHHLLPEHLRNQAEYTIPDYALTLYSKQCFIRRASDLFPDYTHYAWIDFGYARTPEDAQFPKVCTQVPNDQIYISSFRRLDCDENNEPVLGDWGSDHVSPYDWNNWRLWMGAPMWIIQGNLWFVPKKFTHWVEQEMDRSIERQHAEGLVVCHEEPLWLPIIHDFRSRFKIHTKTEWRQTDWV
jgi:hypothetical protein